MSHRHEDQTLDRFLVKQTNKILSELNTDFIPHYFGQVIPVNYFVSSRK